MLELNLIFIALVWFWNHVGSCHGVILMLQVCYVACWIWDFDVCLDDAQLDMVLMILFGYVVLRQFAFVLKCIMNWIYDMWYDYGMNKDIYMHVIYVGVWSWCCRYCKHWCKLGMDLSGTFWWSCTWHKWGLGHEVKFGD